MPSHREVTTFHAEGGFVYSNGPPLAAKLSPEDAIDIGDRMIDAAADALGQRKIDEIARNLKPV